MHSLVDRFLRYIKIDTQSNQASPTCPSTEKQKDLSNLLMNELNEMGLNAFVDQDGYTYTHIKGNKTGAPAIGLVAHVDTSPDAPGNHVKPRIIEKYDGSLIKLNTIYQMDPKSYPSLARVIGQDIIVTDGTTLLGADDKCGVAEIMEVAKYFTDNPKEQHGDIYICFTPDEEIGRGADRFNHDFFKADFAYTADGSEVGGLEYENFNAASVFLTFTGKSIHPGSAKHKMINATHIAMEFHHMLPVGMTPENTEGYEGFNHLHQLEGEVEFAHSTYLIRNHDMTLFNKQKDDFNRIANYLNDKYDYEIVTVKIEDSYYNMHEIIKDHMAPVNLAKQAIINVGLTPIIEPIRGGTDGARLTYDGLICPNIGTGGYQFHGRFEFASINQMHQAVSVFIEIIKLAAN